MPTDTITIETIAQEMADSFITAERNSGESYTKLKSSAPDWVTDLVYEAHGGMLPDDWRYKCISEACEAIADGTSGEEFADDVDVFSADLYDWLSSHGARRAYTDDARAEFGPGENIDNDIMRGQYMERLEVYDLVYAELENRMIDLEGEE